MAKRINAREKGKRGERAFRDVLRQAGYQARRGQQFKGTSDSPDVVCDDLPEIHWEVKCAEKAHPHKWLAQARVDGGDAICVVVWKRSGYPWAFITEDLLEVIRRSDLPTRKR